MKKQMKMTAGFLLAAGLAGNIQAEFGVSAGASFNYKAGFRNATAAQGLRNDPGAAASGIDHNYDDGYNRVDSSGNAGGQTWYWGYQNATQYDPAGDGGNGTITMSSVQSVVDAQAFSGTQTEAQPALELYWQTDITENARWNLGLRAALAWQRIELDARTVYGAISDTYSLGGLIPQGAPYEGTFAGPGVVLSDAPVRSITELVGVRDIEADLFALHLGPTLSVSLTEKLRLSASAGGTAAWIASDFSYRDGNIAQGRDTECDWLFGGYASADLQYQVGKRWGLFGGVSYTLLNDFEQRADDRSAELEFGDSYSARAGLFFR